MKYKLLNHVKRDANSALLHLAHLSDHAPSPRSISIEITDDCNLNCPMCPRRFAKVTGENMPLERFEYVLDKYLKE